MKRYEKYKPSMVMWLPKIPSHWDMSKAKYYFKYTTGFTPPTGVAEFYNGDITWVTIADINQTVVFDSATKLTQAAIDRFNPDLTLKNSLLYSFKLSVGKVAYAGKDLYTNEAIISILPSEEYDVRYFYYTLPEQLLQNANENIYGAKILNQELIRNASICFPPKEEQSAIANYLDQKTTQIDTLIAKKKKMIELLKEERMAIINQAVTKGVNPDVKLKPSGIEWLGNIPEHWEVKKLKYVVKILSGFSPEQCKPTEQENALPYIKVDNLNIDHDGIDKTKEYTSKEFLVSNKPSILFPKRGAAIALNKVAIVDYPFCMDTNLMGLEIRANKIDMGYLFYIIKNISLISIADTSTIPQINNKHIEPLEIPYPSEEEQHSIVQHIETHTSSIDAATSKIEKEIELLQEYRTALISQVVTGKVKVA